MARRETTDDLDALILAAERAVIERDERVRRDALELANRLAPLLGNDARQLELHELDPENVAMQAVAKLFSDPELYEDARRGERRRPESGSRDRCRHRVRHADEVGRRHLDVQPAPASGHEDGRVVERGRVDDHG